MVLGLRAQSRAMEGELFDWRAWPPPLGAEMGPLPDLAAPLLDGQADTHEELAEQSICGAEFVEADEANRRSSA